MSNPIIEDANIPLFEKVVHRSKQATTISSHCDDNFVLNAILDTDGSISIAPGEQLKASSQLYQGTLRDQPLSDETLLAVLLDPDDVSALIEANTEYSPAQEPLHSDLTEHLLQKTPQQHKILKIEDVLHEDDSVDQYLPEDEDKWYLMGDDKAIDRAIASPAIKDLHDELLMQQLLAQNTIE